MSKLVRVNVTEDQNYSEPMGLGWKQAYNVKVSVSREFMNEPKDIISDQDKADVIADYVREAFVNQLMKPNKLG